MVNSSKCLYRYLKVELRHLGYLSGELDGGNMCPACPKVISTYTLPQKVAVLDKYQMWLTTLCYRKLGALFFPWMLFLDSQGKSQPDRASENPSMGTSTSVINRQLMSTWHVLPNRKQLRRYKLI